MDFYLKIKNVKTNITNQITKDIMAHSFFSIKLVKANDRDAIIVGTKFIGFILRLLLV